MSSYSSDEECSDCELEAEHIEGILQLVENIDRPARARAGVLGKNCKAGLYQGKLIPKVGARANAAVAKAGAQWSVFDADADVLAAGAKAEIGLFGAKAEAKARVAHAQANAGGIIQGKAEALAVGANAEAGLKGLKAGVKAKLAGVEAHAPIGKVQLGLAADCGVNAGADGIGFKVLGCGVNVGPKTAFSLFGNEVELDFTKLLP